MKYIYTHTTDTLKDHVANTISSHLQNGERVVWLLSGGSVIDSEVQIAQSLQTRDTSRLYVGLIDERYGPIGHKDENYHQIMKANFPLPISRVLKGKTAPESTLQFGLEIEQVLKDADYSVAIFGVGTDGHTAGIKPNSPAVTSSNPAVYYEWDDYKRITITAPTIQKIDEVIIYAMGDEKASALNTLLHTNTPVTEQPAQILKSAKTSTLFTDQKL